MKNFKLYLFYVCTLTWLLSACNEEKLSLESSLIQRQEFVSANDALSVVSSFNRSQDQTNKRNLRKGVKKVKETLVISDKINQPAYYIFNFENNRGFMIVSAERKIQPILAFSDEGSFALDKVNPGLQEWMGNLKEAISIYREDKNLKAKPGVEKAWAKYTDDEMSTNSLDPGDDPRPCNWVHMVSNMLSTNWGQGSGYNYFCPFTPSGQCLRAVTGCVATSMAQVMHYHNYPSVYSWGNMPSQASGSCSLTQGENQLSLVMADAGNAVNMSYGPDASGANPMNVEGALENTFGYSSLTERFMYDWQTVMAELNAGRPVILDGGTHMWVCSGYQHSDIDCTWQYLYLWMNWGWDGYANAFYAFDNWAPAGRNYNSNKAMITVHKP